MTDKELIERLRDFEKVTVGDARDAADRIEALTAKVKLMDDLDAINGEKIEALTKERDREKAYAFQCAINLDTALEQLTAARQDAKFAEDELEMQEQEACMMENDYIKLEKERDALEATLAKVVAAAGKMLDAFCVHEDSHQSSAYEAMCAALAETERESHE